jgi:hypothetical protein
MVPRKDSPKSRAPRSNRSREKPNLKGKLKKKAKSNCSEEPRLVPILTLSYA